jgi:hypothetical protein
MTDLTHGNRASWLETIWEAIWELEVCQPETDMDDVKTAMAWIAEELGLDYDGDGNLTQIP